MSEGRPPDLDLDDVWHRAHEIAIRPNAGLLRESSSQRGGVASYVLSSASSL